MQLRMIMLRRTLISAGRTLLMCVWLAKRRVTHQSSVLELFDAGRAYERCLCGDQEPVAPTLCSVDERAR